MVKVEVDARALDVREGGLMGDPLSYGTELVALVVLAVLVVLVVNVEGEAET